MTPNGRRVVLGGTTVDLCQREEVVGAVVRRLRRDAGRPLFVGSANLDHVHHFGPSSPHATLLGAGPADWLVLLDGMPLVWAARRLTNQSWEQLAGSDLLPGLLSAAAAVPCRLGVLGGLPSAHETLGVVLAQRYPQLAVAGFWAPSRAQVSDPDGAAELAGRVHAARVDLLVVALGKPRQERWLSEHGAAAGIKVGLAFGAAADFLAGAVTRAPEPLRRAGLEWLYRLAQEPRRLSRRYLVEGPQALYRVATRSSWAPSPSASAITSNAS